MFKKGMIAAAILAVSGSAFAGGPEAPPPLTYNSGFYAGIGGSRDDAYFDSVWRNAAFDQNNVLLAEEIHQGDFGAGGWDVDFFTGYDWRINDQFNLGVEAFASLSTMRMSISTRDWAHAFLIVPNPAEFSRTLQIKIPYTLGIGLLPAYHLAPGALLYARIAYVNARFKIQTSSFSNPSNGFDGFGANEISRNTNESGIQLGLGQRVRVSDHISIRGEYDWSYYGSLGGSSFTPFFVSTVNDQLLYNGVRELGSNNPEIESVNLSLMYHFHPDGAGPNWQAPPSHVGLQYYAGVAFSRDLAKSDEDFYHNLSFAIPNNPLIKFGEINQSADVKLRGFDGEFFLGAGYALKNRYYLGFEGMVSVSSMDGSYSYSDNGFALAGLNPNAFAYRTTTDFDWSFGFSVMPGFYVTDNTLLYGRVGVVFSEISVNSMGSTTPATAFASIFNDKYSTTEPGIIFGVGMDTTIMRNLSLRTEVDVIKYNGFRVPSTTSAPVAIVPVPLAAVLDRNIFVRPFAEQATLALVYHYYPN